MDKIKFIKTIAIICIVLFLAMETGSIFGMAPEAPGKIELTYIGNAGVLLQWQGKQVMVDGLVRKYRPAYLVLEDSDRKKLEKARPPFDKIDVQLTTHKHLDHFHPESVGRYLRNNPRSIYVTNQQVAADLKQGFAKFNVVEKRVTAINPAAGKGVESNVNGLNIYSVHLPHGSTRFKHIANTGFIVGFGDKHVFHVGDAEMSKQNLMGLKMGGRKIFILLVPYWELYKPAHLDAIRTYIKPVHIVAIHISPGDEARVSAKLSKISPAIVPLVERLKTQGF